MWTVKTLQRPERTRAKIAEEHLRENWQQRDWAITAAAAALCAIGSGTGYFLVSPRDILRRPTREANWTCRTETGRGAIISNLCHSLDGSKERTAEKKGNYRASRATDHMTLHSVISGACLTRKWSADQQYVK